jgi:molybdenum cofactor cytidylyltransferase
MTLNGSNRKKYSAIILAAGLSTRMGSPKLLLPYDKELTFIEQIVSVYKDFGCEDICIVVNENSARLIEIRLLKLENTKLIINPHPEWQKFYSLQLAVKEMKYIQTTFIQNIDNPFVNIEMLSTLAEKSIGADYIVPTYKGKGGHPFLASEQVLESVMKTQDPQTHFKKFMQQFPSLRLPIVDEKIAVNINSKEQYERWF